MRKIIVLLLVISICSCKSQKLYKTVDYNYINEHLIVKRNITKIREGKLITLNIKSNISLKGYFTINERYNKPVHLTIDTKCPYKPFFQSNNEIRFVFSDPQISDEPKIAIPIPEKVEFKISYILMDVPENENFTINGRILYLVNNRPAPELKIVAKFR
ncbi:MAG: hypothetical protein COB60_04235 [Flavobacteriaceae bacterium]|nr:MAG: hypothetical protein COB60_04235 [Flavobacteriaceae bacterium]